MDLIQEVAPVKTLISSKIKAGKINVRVIKDQAGGRRKGYVPKDGEKENSLEEVEINWRK